MDIKDIIGFGKEVIKLQSDSIKNLVDLIDENFENAIKLIIDSKGRVIVTGIGTVSYTHLTLPTKDSV